MYLHVVTTPHTRTLLVHPHYFCLSEHSLTPPSLPLSLPLPVFLAYPGNVSVALGSNVTLECAADATILIWQIGDLQLGQQSFIDQVIEAGFVLEVTGPEMIPGGYRTTITFPGTERVNDTIDTITCLAGNGFTLHG